MAGTLLALADAQGALPGLDAAEMAQLPELIADAQAACSAWCGQGLALDAYSETHRPGRTRRIRLRNGFVQRVTRVATDFDTVLEVVCDDPSAQRATLELYDGTLILSAYGAATAQGSTLTLSAYATAAQLAAAIAAVPGWSTALDDAYSGWLVADLVTSPGGSQNAKTIAATIPAYVRDITYWNLNNPRLGLVELSENRPEAYRYPDRTWGNSYNWYDSADPRTADVLVEYQAGFDVAAGTVPSDLRRAVLLTAASMLNLTPDGGAFRRESTGSWSGERIDGAEAVPPAARSLLYPYARKRL